MPSIGKTFAHWHEQSFIRTDARWDDGADFYDLELVHRVVTLIHDDLEAAQGALSTDSVPAMARLGTVICDDVQQRLQPWTEGHDIREQTIGALLLAAVSARNAWTALMVGDLRATRMWLLRPVLHREPPDDDSRYEYIAPFRVAIFFHEAQPLPDALVIPVATNWAEVAFVYDRFRGGLELVTTRLFELVQPWLHARLQAMPELAHLALAAAEWSSRRRVDDASLAAGLDALVRSDDAPARIVPALAVHFAETAESRGEDPVTMARHVLREHAGRLTGTETLRLVSLLALRLPHAAAGDIDRVTNGISTVMRDWRQTTSDPQLMADRRGAHFKLVGNILEGLMKAERADLVGEVFGAWLEVAPAERRRDLLFWFATESPGVGWAARDVVRITVTPRSILDLVQALNGFLGLALSVRDIEGYEPVPPTNEPGVPNDMFAKVLTQVGRDFLRLDLLREVLNATGLPPQALVAIPYGAFPIQPTLVREFGRCWPWSVSLKRPCPDRGVRFARLILTGTELGAREVEGVARVLARTGAEVDIVADGQLDRSRFLELYADDEADILWVVGHATFDWEEPRATHLLMPDGSRVSASDLTAAPVGDRRRLLVLNVCEAAMALIAGGLPEFGLGVSAAQPSQAVVGHSWPIVGWPDGALFGRLLADGIAKRLGFFEAYENAVRLLIAGPWAVLQVLDGEAGELDEDLHRAIEGRHGERLAELATWSSATFLE